MPRTKISSAELEQRLEGQVDPVSQLPPGFPAMHSRIPPTPSKFVVAAVQRIERDHPIDVAPDAKELAARDEVRTRFRRIGKRR